MTNDTQVFYAMRVNSVTGQLEPIGRAGTVEAIRRDGFQIDPMSENYVRTSGSTNTATSISSSRGKTLYLASSRKVTRRTEVDPLAHSNPIVSSFVEGFGCLQHGDRSKQVVPASS